jgi:hypothetical protein
LGQEVVLEGRDDAVHCRRDVLSALQRLPCTLGALVDNLPAPSPYEWMAGSAGVLTLIGAGVILSDQDSATSQFLDHGFGFVEPHIAMMADVRRTQLFLEAIRRTVKPGDVVLDLGTGTGVLAIAAAQAGARRVYALERTGIAEIAARMFDRNDVAERVTLIENNSSSVSLPERAHVLIAELLGTDPLCERILEYTTDAVERLLSPQPRLVPSRLRILARVVELPEAVLGRHVVEKSVAAQWTELYGIDFSALEEATSGGSAYFTVATPVAAQWPTLTETTELISIDLAQCPRVPLQASTTAAVIKPGAMNGITVFWEIELAPDIRFSNDPLWCDASCCWGTAVWLLAQRPRVREGQTIRLNFCYAAARSSADATLERSGAHRA